MIINYSILPCNKWIISEIINYEASSMIMTLNTFLVMMEASSVITVGLVCSGNHSSIFYFCALDLVIISISWFYYGFVTKSIIN